MGDKLCHPLYKCIYIYIYFLHLIWFLKNRKDAIKENLGHYAVLLSVTHYFSVLVVNFTSDLNSLSLNFLFAIISLS